MLEIQLWRADVATGLIHLDKASGKVTRTSDLPIYQPGKRRLMNGVLRIPTLTLH